MVARTISAARAELPDLVTRVENGEEVTITRHGRAVAVLLSPTSLAAQRSAEAFRDAELLDDLLDSARSIPVGSSPGVSIEYAEALIARIRADRDAG